MNCSDKDCFSTNPVHVDAGPSLQVVEMDVPKLCDQVDHIVLGAHLSVSVRVVCECVSVRERPAWRQGSRFGLREERRRRELSSGMAGSQRLGFQPQ